MFFSYFSKIQPIKGRELLVGQREDFLDFSQSILDLSIPQKQKSYNPFESISEKKVTNFDSITINHNTVILMNTLNPMFVHKVNKLLADNEVVLLTHYLWSSQLK